MDQTALNALLASTLSSLLGLSGGFLLLWQYLAVKRFASLFVSFAAGALLGAVFFDLLAEGVTEFPGESNALFTWVAGGFLLFFIIEKVLRWHHHEHSDAAGDDHRHVLGPMIIFGDAVHNFIDGTIIAAAFLVDAGLGVATAVAVFFHELPQEIGDFSVMISAGMARGRVVLWNVLGALVSPLATVLTLLAAERINGLELPLLGIAAGSFLYIASADLIPAINQQRGSRTTVLQLLLLVIGMLVMLGVGVVFPHQG
ncbi:MAG: ZIP family metal transporter [Candidatus Kerfeldbacteria bacterium]|nr:ZIP family metal transporter [Candidatus Kerfeldbacteria bacterium]